MLFALFLLPFLLSLAGAWRWAWIPVATALALPLLGDPVGTFSGGYELMPGFPLTLSVVTALEMGKMAVLLWVYLAVHIYSVFYMQGVPGRRRYFALLGLFLVGMSTLMAATSWLAILLGWETIGLASFGLVSFYRGEEGVGKQATYVFWINRLGDVALLIGIILAMAGDPNAIYGLVGAAVVKSAQVPFAIWLPWAMVGPTPVSALLHAATLVVSGVVLLTHPLVQPLLLAHPTLCQWLTAWASVTALIAAYEACRTHNLKKLLAYSTLAHVALMMLWPYVEGGRASLWHLGTHAFFKTGLFLGVGLLHRYEAVPTMPLKTVFIILKGKPWLLLTALLALMFVGALLGLSPFAAHSSKLSVLFASPNSPFWTHPWMLLGRVVFIVLYLMFTAVYAVRFLVGYWEALAVQTPDGTGVKFQVALLAALVPLLFWQPFRQMGYPTVSMFPSAAFADVVLGFALMVVVGVQIWGKRKKLEPAGATAIGIGNQALSLPVRLIRLFQVVDNFWGMSFKIFSQLIIYLSRAIGWLDAGLGWLPKGIAYGYVVGAWVLESAERSALFILRFLLKILVMPFKWLVDVDGKFEPARMAWTAIALGMAAGLLFW